MSLASILAPFVPAKLRQRGAEYLRNGLVTLTACEDRRVEAVVTGTEDYDVVLLRDGRVVWADCSCPFCEDREEVCKHIWATILAADENDGLRGARADLPKELAISDRVWKKDREDGEIESPPPSRKPPLPHAPALPTPPAPPSPKPA